MLRKYYVVLANDCNGVVLKVELFGQKRDDSVLGKESDESQDGGVSAVFDDGPLEFPPEVEVLAAPLAFQGEYLQLEADEEKDNDAALVVVPLFKHCLKEPKSELLPPFGNKRCTRLDM